jgi:hypothetical protein
MSESAQKASAQSSVTGGTPIAEADDARRRAGPVAAVHALLRQAGNRAVAQAFGAGAALAPEIRREMERASP